MWQGRKSIFVVCKMEEWSFGKGGFPDDKKSNFCGVKKSLLLDKETGEGEGSAPRK